MNTHERRYPFDSPFGLDRFMHGFDNWSGYTLSGYYGPQSKTGDIKVMQALPFMQARVPWRIEGTTVYFDFCYAEMHFDQTRLEKIYDFFLEQANLFGANLCRSPY